MDNILITNQDVGKFEQRDDGVYLAIYRETKEKFEFEDIKKVAFKVKFGCSFSSSLGLQAYSEHLLTRQFFLRQFLLIFFQRTPEVGKYLNLLDSEPFCSHFR